MCVRRGDDLLLVPTGVHKERVQPADLFRENLRTGEMACPPNGALRPSECAPIFRAILRERGAGSVAHSHGLSAVLAGDLAERGVLVLRDLEMLKGITGCGNQEPHRVSVISNTAREPELTSAVEAALREPQFSQAHCVLVRDHGAYLWGRDLDEVKRHSEVYHFLFEAHWARTVARRGER